MTYIIETERMRLRPFMRADKEKLGFLADPEIMYAWEHGFSEGEIDEWLERNLQRFEKDGCSFFLAEHKQTGETVGAIGVVYNLIDEAWDFEIGYILDKKFWGQGYASEGARGCAEFAFDRLGLERVMIQMRVNNVGSYKTAEKLGAKRIGEYNRFYYGRDMPHYIYVLEKECFT